MPCGTYLVAPPMAAVRVGLYLVTKTRAVAWGCTLTARKLSTVSVAAVTLRGKAPWPMRNCPVAWTEPSGLNTARLGLPAVGLEVNPMTAFPNPGESSRAPHQCTVFGRV